MKKSVAKFSPPKDEPKKHLPKFHLVAPKDLPMWAVVILFVITTIIFFKDQLFGNQFFWEDFIRYVYPAQTFAAKEASAGRIPFWNPYSFSGMPFLADIQVGFFYIFQRLLSLFVDTNGHLPIWIVQFIIIIHFLISQINTYLLAKRLQISSYGSLIAAVSYSFSMIMVCHVIHPMIVYHLAWLPLVVLFIIRGLTEKNIKFSILAGLIYGLSMLGGHPQTTLYEGLFLGIVVLVYLIFEIKDKKLKALGWVKYCSLIILPFIIATGIFSIQYFPTTELAKYSQRDKFTYENSVEGSLQLKQIYTAVVPKLFGYIDGNHKMTVPYYLNQGNDKMQSYNYWETSFYFGVTALIIGLFGISIIYKRREGLLLAALALIGFLYALGENGFLFNIFYSLPLFGTFRNPGRMMFFVTFALSMGAGFGFDTLWKNKKNSKLIIRFIIIAAIPILISLLTLTGVLPSMFDAPEQSASYIQGFGTIAFVLILGVIVIGVLTNMLETKPGTWGFLLMVLAFVDLYTAGGSFNESQQNPNEIYKIDKKLKEMLQPKPPKDVFRVNMRMYEPVKYRAMEDNQGMIDDIMLIEGYNPLILQRARPPLWSKSEVNDLYNVRYEIGIDSLRQSAAFFERKTYLQRAWLVYDYKLYKSEEIEKKLQYDSLNYHKIVALEEQPTFAPDQTFATSDSLNGSVEITDYNSNNIKCSVNAAKAGILCFSEMWYPAWKAYIDGQPTKILRVNYCFRGVEVPAGNHIVEMKYESEAFHKGWMISLVTLVLSLVCLCIKKVR